ncbi:MAG: hypothetical protein IPP64_15900 [Bacteroidetes bacterium]|nr:hypothetical protein [Bacteroidota bacterium]
MLNRILFLFIIPFAFASCKHETVFTEVKVNNRYSMNIPDYLQPCTDLHKDASLQYQNIEKDVYAMVIDEKKKTMQDYSLDYDLDTYFNNIASQGFADNIKDGKVSIPGRQEIDGHKALIAEVTGKLENNEVYYKLGLIETPYEFYQILVWTRASNKEELEPDFVKILESFKELPHPAEELPEPKISDSVAIIQNWDAAQ